MFVAGMAESSGDAALGSVASWGPVLEEVCQALDPFILALYLCWIDGPSQAAGVYRQRVEHMPTDGAQYRHLLEPFAGLLGSPRLEAIRCSERLEPAVIGTLSQVSAQLWDRSTLPLHDQERSCFLDTPHLHALLPLALWRSPSPVEANLDIAQLHSLSDVLHVWKRHQGLA
jgi:hypothetical protein